MHLWGVRGANWGANAGVDCNGQISDFSNGQIFDFSNGQIFDFSNDFSNDILLLYERY